MPRTLDLLLAFLQSGIDVLGEGSGNPLQYCCLQNPIDRVSWQITVHGVAKELDMT